MTLQVIHFYNALGNTNLDIELSNGTVRFITLAGLCTNTIETWELVNGQLFLCEMYSKFDEEYERSDSEYFFIDNEKTYHNWLDSEILIPTYLIPTCQQVLGTHYQITIKNGYLDTYNFITIYDDPNEDIF